MRIIILAAPLLLISGAASAFAQQQNGPSWRDIALESQRVSAQQQAVSSATLSALIQNVAALQAENEQLKKEAAQTAAHAPVQGKSPPPAPYVPPGTVLPPVATPSSP